MFGLSENTIKKLRDTFACVSSVEEVIVYGSRARGDYRACSDIDITLRGNSITSSDLTKLYFLIDDLLLPYTIDLSVFSEIRNEKLIENIEKEGVQLFSIF